MSNSGIELRPLNEAAGGKNITVPGGETIIGRGPFLQVADKRVSRKHGLLEVKDGDVFLTPTHMNPCFYRESGAGEQITLTKDVAQKLENGDHFSLLPDTLHFEVVIVAKAQPNGAVNSEESKDSKTDEVVKDDETDKSKETKDSPAAGKNIEPKMGPKSKQPETNNKKVPEPSKSSPGKTSTPTSPSEKKRTLPNWMVEAASAAPSPTKKPKTAKVTKPIKAAAPVIEDDEEEDMSEDEVPTKPMRKTKTKESIKKKTPTKKQVQVDSVSEGESDEPQKNGRGRAKSKVVESPSEDEIMEEESEEEYKPKPNNRGRGRRKASPSEQESSEEEFNPRSKRKSPSKRNRSPSDDDESDEEYSPRAKSKKRSKPRTPVKRRQPSRRKKYDSEEDDSDDDNTPSKRPSRAAKTKRASYVDDFVADEFSDASEAEIKTKDDQDSDFVAEEDDSGSDWANERKGSQQSKRSRGRPQPVRKSARKSRRKNFDSDDDESEEEYTPRPSRRRSAAKPTPKKSKHRTPCEFGKKCYRKNPAHFKQFAHPGDSSYDEEGSEESGAESKEESGAESKEESAAESKEESGVESKEESAAGSEVDDKPECQYGTECFRKSAEHLKKFKHTKAPKKAQKEKREKDKKSVIAGDSDDDGEANTYDRDDSFIAKSATLDEPIDDNDGSENEDDSENVKDLVKESKAFLKNKKMVKPVK